MDIHTFIIGIIGNVISCIVFASPLPTFISIIRKRTTGSFSVTPYVVTLVSQLVWTYYGSINPKGLLVMTISAIGCAFELFYLITYVVLASKTQRSYALKLFSLCILGFGSLLMGTLLGLVGDKRLHIVGFVGAIISILMYFAPLTILKQVIITKSVEYMPFCLTLSNFLCGGIWSGYAIVVRDLFIGVPNGIGLLLGTCQLILYLAFYKRPKQVPSFVKTLKNVKEECQKNSLKDFPSGEIQILTNA